MPIWAIMMIITGLGTAITAGVNAFGQSQSDSKYYDMQKLLLLSQMGGGGDNSLMMLLLLMPNLFSGVTSNPTYGSGLIGPPNIPGSPLTGIPGANPQNDNPFTNGSLFGKLFS